MALSLGISVGESLTIGESNLKVINIVKGYIFTMDVDGREYTVADQEKVEILPQVYVRSGLDRDKAFAQRSGRLAIDAPRSIAIRRK